MLSPSLPGWGSAPRCAIKGSLCLSEAAFVGGSAGFGARADRFPRWKRSGRTDRQTDGQTAAALSAERCCCALCCGAQPASCPAWTRSGPRLRRWTERRCCRRARAALRLALRWGSSSAHPRDGALWGVLPSLLSSALPAVGAAALPGAQSGVVAQPHGGAVGDTEGRLRASSAADPRLPLRDLRCVRAAPPRGPPLTPRRCVAGWEWMSGGGGGRRRRRAAQ